jgi:hypothetical protein
MKRIIFLTVLLFAASSCLLAQRQNIDSLRARRAGSMVKVKRTPPTYTNVKSLDNSLTRLQQVNGVRYSYGYDTQIGTNLIKNKNKNAKLQERVGFVAQELQKVFPELVKADSSGFLYVDNLGLLPVIVEALKEQQGQIEQQQQQIDEQKEMITNLMKLLGEANQVMVTKR